MPRFDRPALARRLVSAAVLAPLALGAVYAGGLVFTAMVALAMAVLAHEWTRMWRAGTASGAGAWLLGAVLLAAVAAAAWGEPARGLALIGGGAAVLACLAALKPSLRTHGAAGAFYFGLPALALLALRGEPDGLEAVVWLLAVVWATDTGAFAGGVLIGGPKLWPAVSPKKTWAGSVCGAAAGVLAGAAVAAAVGQAAGPAGAAGLLVSLAAQAGDLLESALKRRAGVKDTGQLIPGHGGLLDRVDSILIAAPVLAGLAALGSGGALGWR